MNYLSVCSGIEAASVAWKPLGWNCVGVSEIEPFPCSVLKHRFPDVRNFGDMTRFEEWDCEGGRSVMAKKVKDSELKDRRCAGERPAYNWDLWLNGETWKAVQGEDYHCKDTSFRAAIQIVCRTR